ncbi:DNA-directed RNA polymerase [Luteibacter sp. 22Crub2.1]|uniref:DNA-directed RNA polymerase n=1 Tax=Luteibacter sp. 22Crub2.1 TaxID=1283288 RepID=UPI0009A7FC60|nr:DNA-directed RNA polymerase [Luteibacter sp. 22Crub2.1]SKB50198.1 DNA-directed RNA polymerase [Luteibacter sp. 22Crub2.1]
MNIVQTTEQDLRARQIALEEESLTLGIDRYKKERERTDEADTGPGKRLVRDAINLVATGIEQFVAEARNGKPGKKHTAVRWAEDFPATELAYLTCRTCMNAVSTGETRVQTAAEAIATAVEDSINYSRFQQEAPGLHKHLQDVLKKATSKRHSRNVMEAAIRRTEVEQFAFPGNDGMHFGMKMIELFIETTGLAELFNDSSHGKTRERVLLRGTPAVLEWLDKAHDAAAHFSPVRMPMLVAPRHWTASKGGGYLTDAGGLVPLVRTRNKAYLRELDNADMPKVYEAINAIQATPWRVNSAVLAVMRDAWEAGGGIGDLPHRELQAVPPLPSEDMEVYKVDHPEEFKAWKRSRAEVYEKNARSASKRVAAAQKIALAARFAPEEAIYFPHTLDFRGRVYPVPGTLNPQGDDQAKALLHFAKGKPLGSSGARWLAIHVANLFGVDKVPFEERIAWVHSNEERILDSALDPLDGQRFWTEADSPYCALAACFEWAGYKMSGEDFVSHLPIALDGSCNGLQNFSAMLRDTVGGEATNLIPQVRPADIYTKVMHVAQARIKAEAEAGNPFAISWDGTLSRDLVKQPVMTLPYGVTKSGMRNQIVEKCKKLGLDDSRDRASYLGDILWESIGQVVIAAREAMDWLKDAAKVAAKGDMPVSWTTPAGFPVLQEYRVSTGIDIKTYVSGRVVNISRSIDGTKLDGRRQALGISPNFVHSCDAAHLKLTVCTALDNDITDFAMIHDSYGTHAADTDILAASLRAAFVEQYSREVLTDFRDELAAQLTPELAEKLPELPLCGDLDLSLVEQSAYFFA